MAKELIFMGRKDGKVRLALFDSSHGVARKLPVKEVPEEVFVQGIKEETLPVRGFGVHRGRVTCKYGDWYKLPGVGEGRAFSIFGLVHFGKVETDSEGNFPNSPHGSATYKQMLYYGLASVEWDTGMFRVLAPGTYFRMADTSGILCYTYDGPVTKNKIHPKQLDDFFDKADYVFEECEAVENIEQIAEWSGLYVKSPYVFLQWMYQKCEPFAYREDSEKEIKGYLLGIYGGYDDVKPLLLGKKPIERVDIPEYMGYLSVLSGRQIKVIDVNDCYSADLYGVNGVDVYCSRTSCLSFGVGTKARLIRSADSVGLSVCGWEGYDGSGGDYTGLGIDTLTACFKGPASSEKFIIDASTIRNCFQNMINVEVIMKRTPKQISDSFSNFVGDVKADAYPYLDYSFNKAELQTPLDLTQNQYISNSCNDFKGLIILPEAFGWVERRVFQNSGVDKVKMKVDPATNSYIGRYGSTLTLTIDNDNLTVEVESVTPNNPLKFRYGSVKDLYCTAAPGSLSPRFQYTSILPTQPVTGVTELVAEAFVRVNRATLDFGLFPEVSVVPKEVANDCKFSTIIFGPNIKKIEAGAFVYCDSIRWVYIPKEVEEIDHFIRRPRIPYTIVTQQGSPADAYAKKHGIDVRYADGVDEFKRVTQEIPEEMEGAVAIAILSGKGDGEEAAVLQACERADIPEDYKERIAFIEKTDYDLEKVDWVNKVTFNHDKPDFNVDESPRLHAVMAIISNSAEYNPNVLKVTHDMLRRYTDTGMFRSGAYAMAYASLDASQQDEHLIWLVMNGTKVINAFTEKVSAVDSSISIRSALKKAKDIDKEGGPATMLSNIIEHINLTGRGVSVRGKSLKDWTSDKVYEAMRGTYALLGVYKGTGNLRYFVGVDMTNLNLVSFKLSSGVVVDDGKQKYSSHDIWGMGLKAIGGTQDKELASLDGLTRMYSVIGGADTMLLACLGVDLPKCTEYDFTRPQTEVKALSTLLTVLSGYGPSTTTVAELKEAFRECGLAVPLSAKAWEKLYENSYFHKTEYHCKDGKVKHYEIRYGYNSWFELEDGSVYAFAFNDNILGKLQSIVSLYETDFDSIGFREEHYALVNKMLPASEFLFVRDFMSGGTYNRYGSASACLAISRISGKPCVAVRISGHIVPLFWTNSFANAVRILELSGYILFNPNQDWAYKSGANITSGIFADEREFDSGIPSFKYASEKMTCTREYIRRGEVDGYACPKGNPEVFALATKNPKVSDYVEGGAN